MRNDKRNSLCRDYLLFEELIFLERPYKTEQYKAHDKCQQRLMTDDPRDKIDFSGHKSGAKIDDPVRHTKDNWYQ